MLAPLPHVALVRAPRADHRFDRSEDGAMDAYADACGDGPGPSGADAEIRHIYATGSGFWDGTISW